MIFVVVVGVCVCQVDDDVSALIHLELHWLDSIHSARSELMYSRMLAPQLVNSDGLTGIAQSLRQQWTLAKKLDHDLAYSLLEVRGCRVAVVCSRTALQTAPFDRAGVCVAPWMHGRCVRVGQAMECVLSWGDACRAVSWYKSPGFADTAPFLAVRQREVRSNRRRA